MTSLLIFVLFLGPLVFFHELGHFLFAKYFGVRVETFSIGFGPKLFKFKRGDTTYAVSAIPLGGYVKMFGDNILEKDKLPEEERKFAFTHKTKWQRFWIVFGGPLANFLLAFAIFFALSVGGEKVPEPRIGSVASTSTLYESGFRTGDLLVEINDTKINSLTDFAASGEDQVKRVLVKRGSETKTFFIAMGTEEFLKQISKSPSIFRSPYVVDNEGKFWALTNTAGKVNEQQPLYDFYLSNGPIFLVQTEFNKDQEPTFLNENSKRLDVEAKDEKTFFEALSSNGYYPIDLRVKSIVTQSPAEKAGILARDIIISVDGKSLKSFEELRAKIQTLKEEEAVNIGVLREGKVVDVSLVPDSKKVDKETIKTIGVYSGGIHIAPKLVQTAGKGFFPSIAIGLQKTWDTIVSTLVGFKKLIFGDVSLKTVGGPIAIAKVASDSFNVSISYFLKIMALISVNLGIINLFPIPVLDGGHIVFIIVELIKGAPVGRKAVERSLQFGVTFLFLLIAFAIVNDLSRFFS